VSQRDGVPVLSTKEREQLAALNERLVQAAKGLHILQSFSWPRDAQHTFLDSWGKKEPRLPEVTYTTEDYSEQIRELDSVANAAEVYDGGIGRISHIYGYSARYTFRPNQSWLYSLIKSGGY